MSSETINSAFTNVFSSGAAALEAFGGAANIGLTAVKRSLDANLDLGSAITAAAGAQVKVLSDLTPSGILQRQSEVGANLGRGVQAYFETVRDVAVEAHVSVTNLFGELTSRATKAN